MLKQIKMPQGILSWKRLQFTIIDFTLANENPREAWKTLLDSGFGEGNAIVSRLRRDQDFASVSDSDFLRSILYKIRTYFESNPDDTEY